MSVLKLQSENLDDNTNKVQEQKYFQQANNLIEEFVGEPVFISSSFIGTRYKRDVVTNEVIFDPVTHQPIIEDEPPAIGKQYGKYLVNEQTGTIEDLETEEWYPLEEGEELIKKHVEDIVKAHNKIIGYVQGFKEGLREGQEGRKTND